MKFAKKSAALLIIAAVMLFSFCLSVSAEDSASASEVPDVYGFEGKNIGAITGSSFDELIGQKYQNAKTVYFNANPDMVIALRGGKIDAFIVDRPVAESICRNEQGLVIARGEIAPDDYGFIFPKNETGEKLQKQFNELLEELQSSGELEAINDRWLAQGDTSSVDIPENGENGVINMATTSTLPPFTFRNEEGITGFDLDLAGRFCKKYGYGLKLSDIDISAVITAVGAGKYDMYASTVSITDERKQSVLFSEPVYNGGVVLVTLLPGQAAEASGGSFFGQIAESFDKTFIRENRYQLILQGILTTMIISVLAVIFGTVSGFGVCLLKRVKNKLLSGIAVLYIKLIQGTPIVVFLMIMCYIVFGKSDIDPLWVAVICFAMNFSASAAEIMRTGIDAVDNGQIEAAKAIGFTPAQTFIKIVMPQAARHFLPVYTGEVISLVKSTSVAGYIAVQDLTKMGDIIRSRTYEAFFPLIATAVIYFVLAYLLSLLLKIIMKKIGPDRRKRTVKGVVMK